jgi:uncharacterized protein YrrD
MRKAKELVGKPIVNQATGEHLATVRDLIFDTDARHVAALLVDSGGWFRDARVILWESIASIGDIIMVRGEAPVVTASSTPKLSDELKQDIRISGMPIMSESGERIGTVGDLFINDAGEVVGYGINQGFINDLAGRKFLFVDHVQTIGRDAIIADGADLTSVKQAQQEIADQGPPPDERTV